MVEDNQHIKPEADFKLTAKYVDSVWEDWFIKGLSEFVQVPNSTPLGDKEYYNNHFLD